MSVSSVSSTPPPIQLRVVRSLPGIAAVLGLWIAFAATAVPVRADQRPPDVLFISIDDLNDWASPFGGHPQAKTPNLERLANQGAVVFQNAHCPGPVCGPSRSALLSGFMPNRTGIYGNAQNMLASALVQTNATLPEYFAKHGYDTVSRGKIFHAHTKSKQKDRGQWAFTRYESGGGGSGRKPDLTRISWRDRNLVRGKPGPESKHTGSGGSPFAFGPTVGDIEDMPDYQTALWAAQQLAQPSDRPRFLAVGFSKPHLPFHCPASFFEMHPIDSIVVNPIDPNDLDDIISFDQTRGGTKNGKPKFKPTADYQWLQETGLTAEATQAYLACCSFADACVGVVLDGLAASGRADNTIIVLWGDHGWHLGEKLRYRKATGWIEATRLPLIIRTPTMTRRADCDAPVNLMDLYATLVDYAGLPEKQNIDGTSLLPLLADPEMRDSQTQWREATVTVLARNSASIVSRDWHLIRYQDGTEELYDRRADPMEWTNLIQQMTPESTAAKSRLMTFWPADFAPLLDASDKNTLDFRKRTLEELR